MNLDLICVIMIESQTHDYNVTGGWIFRPGKLLSSRYSVWDISLHILVQNPAAQSNSTRCVTSLSFRSSLSASNAALIRTHVTARWSAQHLVSSVLCSLNHWEMSPCLTKWTGFLSTIVTAVRIYSIFSGDSMKTLLLYSRLMTTFFLGLLLPPIDLLWLRLHSSWKGVCLAVLLLLDIQTNK